MRVAVYAGSFDPVTNGHLAVIEKARGLVDVLHVIVAVNPDKRTMFTLDERVELLRCSVPASVVVGSTRGYVVDEAKRLGAQWLIRGVRDGADATAELQLASLNATLAPEITTVFVAADPALMDVSSSRLKRLAAEGADLSRLCPPAVAARLRAAAPRSRLDL